MRFIDCVYHSTLGLSVIKKRRRHLNSQRTHVVAKGSELRWFVSTLTDSPARREHTLTMYSSISFGR